MEHINITFPPDLKEALDRTAKQEKTKRSTLIQKAVKMYLRLKQRKKLNILLSEAYREMADEAKVLRDEFKAADQEHWPDVD